MVLVVLGFIVYNLYLSKRDNQRNFAKHAVIQHPYTSSSSIKGIQRSDDIVIQVEDSIIEVPAVLHKNKLRISVLELRQETLKKEIIEEGWLRRSKNHDFQYAVLRPTGEISFYKGMVVSGFGNIHINLLQSWNIRDCVSVSLLTPKKRKDQMKYGLLVVERITITTSKEYILYCKSEDNARRWYDAINILLSVFHEPMEGMNDTFMSLPPTPKVPLPCHPMAPPPPPPVDGDEWLISQTSPSSKEQGKKLRRVKSSPPLLPLPHDPDPPMLPILTKTHHRRRGASSRRLRSHSTVAPPLPDWPEDMKATFKRSTRRGSSLPPLRDLKKRSKSDPATYTRDNSIWDKFQNNM